jgi:hypothetical protein
MSAAAVNRTIAPIGYIDIRPAITFVRRRMFTSEIPARVMDAARANAALAERGDLTPDEIFKISEQPQIPAYPEPIELIADTLRSGDLTLFIYAENYHHVIPVPAICVHAVLEKVGLLHRTRDTIILRFKNFFPRQILDGLDLPGSGQFETFALCLRERAFDDWLSRTARQRSWPLDAKPRRGSGRPTLVPIVKPIVKDLIDSGRWRQGMVLKRLADRIKSKLEGGKVDRETVKRAMDELYRETGQLEYRYRRLKRRASTKSRY